MCGVSPLVLGPAGVPAGFVGVEVAAVFIFFSNRLGCVGSILVSIVLSIVLILALRSCSGY